MVQQIICQSAETKLLSTVIKRGPVKYKMDVQKLRERAQNYSCYLREEPYPIRKCFQFSADNGLIF